MIKKRGNIIGWMIKKRGNVIGWMIKKRGNIIGWMIKKRGNVIGSLEGPLGVSVSKYSFFSFGPLRGSLVTPWLTHRNWSHLQSSTGKSLWLLVIYLHTHR